MIKIIRAEEKHITSIGQLWWEFIIFHQNIDPIDTPIENSIPHYQENHLKRFMKSEDSFVLVALDEGQAIGFSLSYISEPPPGLKRGKFGYIDEMAVTESYRRQGIGVKMVTEILKWFKSKNINRVELGTAAQNVVANSFWQQQGFAPCRYTLYKEI